MAERAGLEEIIARIGVLDASSMRAAAARQDQLTKPLGALGRLEELSIWLAGVQGVESPRISKKVIVTAAADHGVARNPVSAYPSDVTGQMVLNFLSGGAAVNVLARQAGARVVVVDAGVATALPDHPDLRLLAVRRGTDDLSAGPAMSRPEAEACVVNGIWLARELIDEGADVLAVGDMGIGNTTSSAAITSVFTTLDPSAVTGRGTGISDERFDEKVRRIRQGIAVNRPDPSDAIGVLAAVGGLEIGTLAGVCLGAASLRRPVVLDGFIASAAALIAQALCPEVCSFMLASHRSAEAGHAAALAHLGLVPLLDLGLRLGEGTGAALGIMLLEASARVLNEMATFAEAGVSAGDDVTATET